MNLEKLLNRRGCHPSLQLSPKGGEGDCLPSRLREGIKGRAGRKEIQMVDVINALSWRVTQHDFPMPCFCELGDKSPIPAYPASSASSASSAVNCRLT